MNADSVTEWQNQMAVAECRCISLKISFNPHQVFIWVFLPLIPFRYATVAIATSPVPEAAIVTGAEKVMVNARAGAIS
jgi:hypothetical protein